MAAVVPIGPPCPDCWGGGEINGIECRSCGGSTRAGKPKRRRRFPSPLKVADTLAVPAGTVVRWSLKLPALLGAIGLSYAAGEIVGHVFGHGLAPWVGLAVGSMFGLLIDRKVP